MESAGKVYAQNPDPDTKLGDLETMELSKLKILQTRYKNIVGNRALLSRLRDCGESARRTLAAVEAELAARGAATEPGPPPLESRAASEVERLAQRMAQMEWDTGRRTVSAPVELDSDDDSEPEAEWPTAGGPSEGEEPRRVPAVDNCTARPAADAAGADPGSGVPAVPTTRQLLPKSATSGRQTRFSTNRPRWPGGRPPPAGAARAPARRGVLSQWSDSALAAPARPDTHTRLLNMDESLQLLTRHDKITQEERSAQLAARLAAPAHIEGGEMELDADSGDGLEDGDSGPVVVIGAGDWS